MTVGTAKLNRSPDGHKMLNHYALLHELGKGSNGEVRLVRDTLTGVLYACKSVNRPAHGSPEDARGATRTRDHEACAGLRKEIALGSRLRHPNIVNMVEAIDDPTHKKIYVIMMFMIHKMKKNIYHLKINFQILEKNLMVPSLLFMQ